MAEKDQKPVKSAVDTAKDVASTAKGVAKTFLFPRSDKEEENTDYSPGPEPKTKTPGLPQRWYKDSDKHGLPSYKNGTDYVPETGPAFLHEGEKVVSREKNMDVGKVASALGSSSGDTGALANKANMIDEYKNSLVTPSSQPKAAPKPLGDTPPVDKVGQKPYGKQGKGEKKIDTEKMRKPLGAMPSYKDGVDSVPEDGPAMLHEGEKVVPEAENADSQKRVKSALGGDKPKQLKAKKGSKKQVHKITVHRAANGGVVLEHHMGDGSKNEMHHHPDFDGAVNHMREHFQDSQSASEQGQSDGNEGPSMAVPPAAPQSTPNPQEN
jgi:hypothetical protein